MAQPSYYHLVGRVIGDRYSIDGRIGEGSNGLLYSATDRQGGARVAVKVLFAASDAEWIKALKEDLFAVQSIAPARIARLLHIDETEGRVVLLREWLEGHFLDSEIAHGPMTPQRVLSIVSALCEILEGAGGRAHGNLKPGNVFVGNPVTPSEGGTQVKLVDFALGPLSPDSDTRNGWCGNSLYEAPELRKGAPRSHATDIFALGALARRMLLAGSASEDRSLEVAPALVALVQRAMAEDFAARPASLSQLAKECAECQTRLSQSELLAMHVAPNLPKPSPQSLPPFPTNYSPPPERPKFNYRINELSGPQPDPDNPMGRTGPNIGFPPTEKSTATGTSKEELAPLLQPLTNIGRPPQPRSFEEMINPTGPNIGAPPADPPRKGISIRVWMVGVVVIVLGAIAWWLRRG